MPTIPKQYEHIVRVGREIPAKAKLDNIDLDVQDAEALGYGCHYGAYKADHPNTKEDNAPRLAQAMRKRRKRDPKDYDRICPICGREFTAAYRQRIYCSDKCKMKKSNAAYRSARQK